MFERMNDFENVEPSKRGEQAMNTALLAYNEAQTVGITDLKALLRPHMSGRGAVGRELDRMRRHDVYETLTDTELVSLVTGGQREAFGELVSRYRSKVNRLALKITKNEIDAQEVVQEVFLSAFSKLDSFKGTAAFSSWLYRVAANGALMLLRSRRRENHESWDELQPRYEAAPQVALSTSADWATQADRVCERKEIIRVLGDEFEQIPERYRTILILRELDGLSNREISDVLGISVAAVKSRLHRARIALRKRLVQYWPEVAQFGIAHNDEDDSEEFEMDLD